MSQNIFKMSWNIENYNLVNILIVIFQLLQWNFFES